MSEKTDSQLALPGLEIIKDLVAHTAEGMSNTFELFDALIPYSSEHARGKSNFLEIEKRFRGLTFNVKVAPAVLQRGGKPLLFLPGRRENLVEKALRKMAADSLEKIKVRNKEGTTEVSVDFTLHELRNLLASQGHGFKISELAEALEVLAECKVQIVGDIEGSDEIAGINGLGILQNIQWSKKKSGDEEGRAYRMRAIFHPLITRSLIQRTFRQINFGKLMKPKNELARWLYSRLSHNYTQASGSDLINYFSGNKRAGYHISLSTIIKEYGLNHSDLRLAMRAVRNALKVMQEHDILTKGGIYEGYGSDGKRMKGDTDVSFPGYIEEIRYGEKKGRGRKAIVDVIWNLFPSNSVVDDIIKANKNTVEMKASNNPRRL